VAAVGLIIKAGQVMLLNLLQNQMATSHLLPRIMNLAQSERLTPVEIALLIEKGYVQCGFERVMLFGGGASFLKSSLPAPARNVEVVVLPEPEFANARGFHTLAFDREV
jgi:plasmid segregation protein ParM